MNDSIPLGQIYPASNYGRGASTGQRVSAASAFHGMPTVEAIEDEHGLDALQPGAALGTVPGGSILAAGAVFAGLLALLMLAARHSSGESKEFAHIKPSAYNVLVIALAGIVGIPVLKFGLGKIPIPAVRAWIGTV